MNLFSRFLFCLLAVYLFGPPPLHAQNVVINEFMASNGRTIADEDGDYEDWIELYNAGSEPVNLEGWGLTDDLDNPFRWQFPSVVIGPGEFLLVFASGKDYRGMVTGAGLDWYTSLETATAQQAAGIWLFDEGGGSTAEDSSGGANHGIIHGAAHVQDDELGSALRFNRAEQQYVEIPNAPSLQTTNSMTISMWIKPASLPGRQTVWDKAYGGEGSITLESDGRLNYYWGVAGGNDLPYQGIGSVGGLKIDEWTHIAVIRCLERGTVRWHFNGDLLQTTPAEFSYAVGSEMPLSIGRGYAGAFDGWIARPMLLPYAADRQLHANFRISSAGEPLQLTQPDGTVADRVDPIELPRDVSYGRFPDGEAHWYYYETPTPFASNNEPGFEDILEPPVYSKNSGFFTNAFELVLSHPDPEALILYTLDGSEPDVSRLNSGSIHRETLLYEGPLWIQSRVGDSNIFSEIKTAEIAPSWYPEWSPPEGEVFKATVVRAKAVKEGTISPYIRTRTYFVDEDISARYETMPIISIVVDYRDFFDPATGIYVPGDDPQGRWDQNFHQNWRRHGHVQFFDIDRDQGFHGDYEIRIQGSGSPANPQKGLHVTARANIGENRIHYPIFNNTPGRAAQLDEFRRFIIRAWGSDRTGPVFFGDAYNQTLAVTTDQDIQSYRPAIVFMNGEYWGLHDVREANKNSWYYQSYYGIDREDPGIDLIDQRDVLDEGDWVHWNELWSYINAHDLTDDEAFAAVKDRVNTLNLIQYISHCVYTGKRDWPRQNEAKWRPRTPDGRWRWVQFDMDAGFSPWAQPEYDMLAHVIYGEHVYGPHHLFVALLENEAFKNQFILTYADWMNTYLSTSAELTHFDSMADELAPYIEEYYHRWPIGHDWEAGLDVGRNVLERRSGLRRAQLKSFFDLTDVDIELNVSDLNHGHIRVNTVDITHQTPGVNGDPYPWGGFYFTEIPIELEARPHEGYRFLAWMVSVDGSEPEPYSEGAVLEYALIAETSFMALFEPIPFGEQEFLLHEWDFEDETHFLVPSFTVGGGNLHIELEEETEIERNDPAQDFATHHLRVNDPLGAKVIFSIPTKGYEAIELEYLTRRSGQGAGEQTLSYTTNGVDWIEWDTYTVFDAAPQQQTFDFSSEAGVADNMDFAIRITFNEADGGASGNNRFDDVQVRGVRVDPSKTPPEVEEAPGLRKVIEGGAPATLDLDVVFSGDSLTYSATSSDTNKVQVSVAGSDLTLTPVERGEALISVTADDGHYYPVTTTFRVLVYPEAYVLENGNFTFTEWDPDTPEKVYPEHMFFLQSDQDDTVLDTPLLYAYDIDDYHSDDSGTIGFPYNNTRRTRINGLGEDGIAFINTGQGRDLGGALVALDTRNVTDAPVGWLAGTVLANNRIYAIRLQYRVGTDGPWIDVLDESEQPVEYVRAGDGHTQPMEPVNLPAVAMGQEYVQLLWRYYWTDPEGTTGSRAQLRLDDILVANSEVLPATQLAYGIEPMPFYQSGQMLPPFTVLALDPNGLLDTDFEGAVTLAVAGTGTLAGTTAVSAEEGVATFTNVVVTGIGTNRLQASSGLLDSALSDVLSFSDVTGVLVPRFMQGEQDALGNNNDRIPYAFRAQIDGLLPNATYRYGNRVITPDDPWDQNGAGNMIFVTGEATDWIRNTSSPQFGDADFEGRHYEFTTDATGSYTGWFVTEPSGNARFTPGNTVYLRILLNDGQGGDQEQHYLTLADEVTVIRFGDQANEATGIMGESAQAARNFVYLYDNTDGTNRPFAGVPIEITGSVVDDRYAPFYEQVVASTPQFWGALIPNTLPTGVRRIEARSIVDGSMLTSEIFTGGIPETINPEGGLDAILVGADEGIPVFLPGGDGRWDLNASWSTGIYPDGVDAEAIIKEPFYSARDVDIESPVTIGHLMVDNGASTNMNRIRARGANTLTFESSSGPAQLTIDGAGSGFVEFRTQSTIELASDLLITITNVNENHGLEGVLDDDYGALRLRDTWTGQGGLTKAGAGVMTLTGGGKDYSGETIVDFGVLRITEPATPQNTAGVTVNPGGQLRLVSDGDRLYPFGGVITLNSMGRGGDVPLGEELGIRGALRYDPGSNDNRAEVTNHVVIAGSTSLHVDGSMNVMALSGALSGLGAFSKSGGGTLVLSGDSSAYTVPVMVSNGTLQVDGVLGAAVWVDADGAISGAGAAGALSGSGWVIPSAGGPGLTASSVSGLNYRFAMSALGGPLLRLTSGTPFADGLNPANEIEVFLGVESLVGDEVFEGGFFTDSDEDFWGQVEHATWRFYLLDAEGEVEFNGESYSLYDGELELEVATAARAADFGAGAVAGRMLLVGFDLEEPTGYNAWRRTHFTALELTDDEISGPLADADNSGIPNLLRHALGLGRYDAYEGALPRGVIADGEPRFLYRRLVDAAGGGVEYVLEISSDLLAEPMWSEAEEGDMILEGTTPVGDDRTEVVKYRVVMSNGTARFIRLRVMAD